MADESKVDKIAEAIDPELAKEILKTKAEEEAEAEARKGTKTVRIPQDVWDVIAKHGKFGETIGDVLRRIFKDYGVGQEKKE